MKFTKRKNYQGTVRKVWNDEKTELLGIVGTFKDFKELGIIEEVTGCSINMWICIPEISRINKKDGIGITREEAIENAAFGEYAE